MVFSGTGNLGDMVQAVALSRLLGPTDAFFRDQPHLTPPEPRLGVAAGFLLGPFYQPAERLLLAGVWYPAYHEPHIPWISRSSHPVGARDPDTYGHLRKRGIRTEMVGCVTLTMPEYTGPRSGTISVDTDGPGERLTHDVPKTLGFVDEWKLAVERLSKYRTASVVHTSRIHVALPCVAFGTPVRYVGPRDGRTSIVEEVGLRWGKISAPDPSGLREIYLSFLERNLGRSVLRNGQPVRPTLPSRSS